MGIAFGTLQALAFRILGTAFLALIAVITSRALSEEDRGVFFTTTVIIGIAGSLAASFSSAAGFFVTNRKIPAGHVAANSVLLSLAIGLLFLLGGIAWDAAFAGQTGTVGLLVGATLFPLIARYAIGGVYLGEGRIGRYSLALHGHSYTAVAFLLIWVVFLDHRTMEDALGAWIAAQYASLVLVMLITPSWWGHLFRAPDLGLLGSFLTFGTVTGLAGVISFLNYRIDQLLVAGLDSEAGAAIYGNAVVIAEGTWLFSTAISVATYARVGSLGKHDAADLTVKGVRHTWIAAGAGMIGLLVFAGLVVRIYGDGYAESAGPLRLLAIATAIYAPQAVISNYFTVTLGRPGLSLGLAGMSLAMAAVFGVVFIPALGYMGGAWATLLSYAITATVSTALFVRLSDVRPIDLVRYRREDFMAYIDLVRGTLAKLSTSHLAGARTKS